jgi:carnitine 3-dehydrogenase
LALRWAQKGLFETYRVAGGQAGMKHFLEQFGPCLEWPWTKLMDVPDLNEELIDRIVEQSDEQAAGRTVMQLESERDRNLVALLKALREEDAAAGAFPQRG